MALAGPKTTARVTTHFILLKFFVDILCIVDSVR